MSDQPTPAPGAGWREFGIIRYDYGDKYECYADLKKARSRFEACGEYFPADLYHVVEIEALRAAEKERDEYVAEAEHFQNKCLDLDLANGMLRTRIAELEHLAHVTDESSYRAKVKRLVEELEVVQKERDRFRLGLEKAQAESSWPLVKGLIARALEGEGGT